MVSVIARMKYLRAKLFNLRNGLGAATFPREVKRVALTFNYSNKNGHMSSRYFWKLYLPRIQYHNPDVQIDLIRESKEDGPADLTVYYDKDIPPRTVDMLNKAPEDICKELLELTQAQLVPDDPNEVDLGRRYEEIAAKRKKVQDEELKVRQRRKKNLKAKRPKIVEDVL